jgi:hypothetical protein
MSAEAATESASRDARRMFNLVGDLTAENAPPFLK